MCFVGSLITSNLINFMGIVFSRPTVKPLHMVDNEIFLNNLSGLSQQFAKM